MVFTLTSILPYEASRAARSAPPRGGHGPGGLQRPAADTGRLLPRLQRYGSADSLKTAFGITDNDLYDWLEGHGFQVQRGSHANFRATDFSLAATLNMKYLDELTERIGRVLGRPDAAQAMLHDHLVGKEFQAMGYRYVHLGYGFRTDARPSVGGREHHSQRHERVRVRAARHDDGARRRAKGRAHVLRAPRRRRRRCSNSANSMAWPPAPGPKFVLRAAPAAAPTSSARMARFTRRKRCAPWRRRGSTPGSWRS